MDYLQRAKAFRAKKRLGQNFLVDADVIEDIIEIADISPDDTVVEIGPGLGFLTEILVQRAKKVFAVELDEDAIVQLEKIKTDNLEIIHNDILKTDISAFGSNLKIVANIPYYITGPIIAHLIGEVYDTDNKNRKAISEITLMTQYEAALRIVANEKSPNKEYGLLSILVQFNADAEIKRFVKARSFFPAPKVNSAVLKLKIKDKPMLELDDYNFFSKVAKACFATRRKNIKNSLSNAGFAANAVKQALQNLGIPENIRGEVLSVPEIGKLATELKSLL
ncbi:MAG: 16S rRNA (adenine(1518)-N(6)/adenine(1519)-N(6))-dimethyltransferase RsmA [Candidatus Gastranaerophilaceae bacterium]